MRILMLDLDTLRPDHLSCYGYSRETSPAIDSIARDGVRFDHYHCSDAPCLPSRAALVTGRFGIHNGIVNHGGLAADLRPYGIDRGFKDQQLENSLFNIFRKAGMHTASISPFAERHSAYWFTAGLNEVINTGKCGDETADEILPSVINWLEKNAMKDNWFLHVNFWDPHTPYRAPMEMGNPFEKDPPPEWITQEVFAQHQKHVGPHSINELGMYSDWAPADRPRQLGKATNMDEMKQVIDGYDVDILYMDQKINVILDFLKQNGLYDDMAIIVTSDHGENMGELGIYAEHGTADEITTRIPMIIKWPGMLKNHVDKGLHYNLDLAPTMAELLNVKPYEKWDGRSYAAALRDGTDCGREYLILSQCAHVCQRSVRFGDYIYIRTYHDGFHLFDREMLFNIKEDFHEQHNIAAQHPDICAKACRYLVDWQHDMLMTADSDIDPLWTVMIEGGPYHAKGNLKHYVKRLEATGRAEGARLLRERHPGEFR
ncbi:MAG TPA: sulfatase-like hydrolase/transferase [Clostridiales bacterium]|nr:sulfatase-like hydrolase/transferase [Clostridiales bacterium]